MGEAQLRVEVQGREEERREDLLRMDRVGGGREDWKVEGGERRRRREGEKNWKIGN